MNDQFQWQWAASPVFFKSILKIDSKNANPVIYLRGVQHYEMESIMQFIYLGEARFYEERTSEFLSFKKSRNKGIVNRYWNECNDQGENNENNDADENMDIAGAPPHAAHEDSVSVEPQAQTEQITANKIIRHKSKKDRGCIWGCNVSMSRLWESV